MPGSFGAASGAVGVGEVAVGAPLAFIVVSAGTLVSVVGEAWAPGSAAAGGAAAASAGGAGEVWSAGAGPAVGAGAVL